MSIDCSASFDKEPLDASLVPARYSRAAMDEGSGNSDSAVSLPQVEETVLKKRKTLRQVKEARAKARGAQRKVRSGPKKEKFIYPENFVHKQRRQQKDQIRMARNRRKKKLSVPAEQKLGFVIRIRGTSGIDQSVRRVLQHLQLSKTNTGVFVKLAPNLLEMLRVAEPYITWGYPDLKTTRDLIMKRGHAQIDGRRVALSDNAVVEEHLGDLGIICLEDIINEVFHVGRNFHKANRFLWPFKLTAPKEGYRRIHKPFLEKGDTGNRGDEINSLLGTMI